MAKLNATAKSDESWRSKLAEQNSKNVPKTKENGDIDEKMGSSSSSSSLSVSSTASPSSSASQKAIIERLQCSADDWKKKRQNEGDAMLQALRQKNATKQQRKNMAEEHQRKVALETERWRQRFKGTATSTTTVKVNLSEKVKELESKEAEWAARYSSTARQELEDQTLRANVHDAVNANIDKFLEIAQSEKEDPNAWKQRLQVWWWRCSGIMFWECFGNMMRFEGCREGFNDIVRILVTFSRFH